MEEETMAKAGKKEGSKKKEKIAYVEREMLEEISLAMRIVLEEKQASTSLIQRRLKVGYARAALLLDRLEGLAVITPPEGAKPRKLTGYVPVLKAKIETVKKVEPVKKPGKDRKKPTAYSEALVEEICNRVACGESVLQICRDDHMPESRTVYLWLLDDDKKDFYKKYEKARVIQAEYIHAQLTEIADDGTNDWMDIETQKGRIITVPDHEHINRSRLRVDTRKWILARMNPKKYGETLDLTTKNKKLPAQRSVVVNYNAPKKPE